jgi:peptidoglycan/xylan/chitin deacetylase (PgdA/CDA1 family)
MLKKKWYIINYHNISWEEPNYLKPFNITCPPDLFFEHVKILNKYFNVVSFDTGLKLTIEDNINSPILSFTFDDCFRGVKDYAFPILREFNNTGFVSICSTFFTKNDIFWRLKMSILNENDLSKNLRTAFKKYGYSTEYYLMDFTLNNFCKDLIKVIDNLYEKKIHDEYKVDLLRRTYEGIDGINELISNGWFIGNHSANHYPVTEMGNELLFKNEFLECDNILMQNGLETKYWVAPFDRISKRSEFLINNFQSSYPNKYLVLVGNKTNKSSNIKKGIINRVAGINIDSNMLLKYLIGLED